MKELKINRADAVLVLVDIQEKLMPVIIDNEELENNTVKLVKGCRILDIPILVAQQYTKGLGPTVPSIHQALGEYEPIEKVSFSTMGEPAFCKKLKDSCRKTVILAGVEAHVCVLQTAIDMIEAGYNVFLAEDCVSSRKPADKIYAQNRMRSAGVIDTTYESVLFELLRDARQKEFKEISTLVK